MNLKVVVLVAVVQIVEEVSLKCTRSIETKGFGFCKSIIKISC